MEIEEVEEIKAKLRQQNLPFEEPIEKSKKINKGRADFHKLYLILRSQVFVERMKELKKSYNHYTH